jgi:hypothetical protein
MPDKIKIGNRIVSYEILRKKVKNITLRIRADLTVTISANKGVSKKYIEDLLLSKGEWILKTLDYYESREKINMNDLVIKENEKVRLLGEDYTIHIIKDSVNKVTMDNNQIIINIKDTMNEAKINSLWNKWYEILIEETLTDMVLKIHPLFYNYHIEKPNLVFRKMKKRWGSCANYSKTITLNKALIHVPIPCIEYVIVHEFTHFIHPNHSKDFYRTLENFMPDYKERKRLLDSQMILY